MQNHDVNFCNETSHINFRVENSKVDLKPVVAIYDKKIGKHTTPFVCETFEDAKRQFSNIVNYSNSLMCKFPEDYCLVHIGDFDDVVGIVIPLDKHTNPVVEATSLKRKDTIQYDELLKEVKGYINQISWAIKDYDKNKNMLVADIEKFRETSSEVLLDFKKKSVDLFPIEKTEVYPSKNKTFITKILDKLFGSY